MKHHSLRALVLALAPLALPAVAQQAAADEAERARISQERARAAAEFVAQEKACYAKFAVNDCIEAARVRRRTVLADLRRQEVALNDAERRRRAADRVRDAEARQAKQASPRTGDAKVREQPGAMPQARGPDGRGNPAEGERAPSASSRVSPKAPKANDSGHRASPQVRPAKTPVDTAENAKRHEERLLEAQQHKERVQKQAAERTKPANSLPVPP